MKSVLILGGSGQVGRALRQSAPDDWVIAAPSSADADFRQPESLRAFVRNIAADVIVNCAAFTRVDDAEREPHDAELVNENAPRVLAEVSAESSIRLLHISTDYVFDGGHFPPFDTGAPPAPLQVYGRTKLGGEIAVLRASAAAAVVRTAWVHSGHGENFVATCVRHLTGGAVMRVVDDQVSTPTSASQLAQFLWQLAAHPEHVGLLHFTDAGVASWYDVAVCVLETLRTAGRAGLGANVLPIDSAQYPRPAARPRVSLLDKHASWTALGFVPSHWRDGVIASTLEIIHA